MYRYGFIRTFVYSTLTFLLTVVLSACGGGGGSSSNNIVQPPANQPTNINSSNTNNSATNWQNARILSKDRNTDLNLEIVANKLLINVSSIKLRKNDHLQVYLDTDNDASTGFQFEGEAWAQSGVDYIIEDGDLFKSITNGTSWDWNTDIDMIDYSASSTGAQISIDLSLLHGICNTINAGVMTRDGHWNIYTFHPVSSSMQRFAVSYCDNPTNDLEPPVITLNGDNPIKIELGSEFNDPGATAYDNIDGDISAKITTKTNVNTEVAGKYHVNYGVTDSSGNSASIVRDVIVLAEVQDGIVIDGKTEDWSNISVLASTSDGSIKVYDDADTLYILVEADYLGENTQVFLDTDNNPATGLQLNAHTSNWTAGADYMLENNSLDKSTANSAVWSWNFGTAPISFVKTSNVLEIAINKSDLGNLSDSIPVGYISRDENWNVNYILPVEEQPSYIMQCSSCPGNPVNANDDSTTTTLNQAVTIDVLANDDGAPLTIDTVSNPANGTAVIVNGKITYTPNADFIGADNFSYQITDNNGNTDTANINVTVSGPINQSPNAQNDRASTQTEQSVTINTLANDSDPDGDALNITAFTQPQNGTVSRSGTNLLYKSNAGFSGTDRFSYTISDGNGGSDSATVRVTVTEIPNNPPVANDDTTSSVGTQAVNIAVLSNDTDADGDTLSVTAFTQPQNGTVSSSGANLVYTADSGFTGTDSFNYTITDGNGGSDTATVTVTVSEVPNNPPVANDDTTSSVGTQAVNIAVLSNDTDADGDTLRISNFTQPQNGTVSASGSNLIYTADSGFSGTDSFNYTITDGNGGSDTASVTVTVSEVPNNPPVANDDTASTVGTLAVNIAVLSNDTDADGDTLSVTVFTQPQNGTVSSSGANLVYTADSGFTGTDSFNYTITDGNGGSDTATVTVTVSEVPNNPPVANDDTTSSIGTQAVNIAVLSNDTDADGDTLSISNFTQPQNGTVSASGSNLIYTADSGFSGTDSFNYTITDGNGGSDTATVNVTVDPSAPNNPPDAVEDAADVIFDETITVNVLANDIDPDGDTLTVTSIVQPPVGFAILNADGTIFFDPQSNVGSITVSYTISDGRGGSDTAALTFSVTDPNDGNDHGPVIENENVTTSVGTPIFIDVLANDTDADGDTLILDQVDQGSFGTTVKVNGGVMYTPNPGSAGQTDIFFYGVHDGHGHNGSGNVTVTVTP